MNDFSLIEIKPTVFLKNHGRRLQQLVKITIRSSGEDPGAAAQRGAALTVRYNAGQTEQGVRLAPVPCGESTHELYIDEASKIGRLEFALLANGTVLDRKTIEWKPPVHWRVHVVQLSHHDVGYTDLSSRVLKEHDRFLDCAASMALDTRSFPDDSQFRIRALHHGE